MIGKTISHYKVVEKLGEGGMGVVYKAEDTRLKRTVALKFLSPQLVRDEEDHERFVREAQAAAALDHPNICTVYEIGESDSEVFIAMSFCDGVSLKEKIESGRMEIDEAVDIALQIAQGLGVAHAKGIIHRDIKSANVMVLSDGQVKVMDFGLAKIPGQTQLTSTGMTPGTTSYMSPEQARGDAIDHRSDLWSLGVVMYEMLTGELPFRGDYEHAVMYSIMNEEPVRVTELRSEVPSDLAAIIEKLMQKDPDSRYHDATSVAAGLRRIRPELKTGDEKDSSRKRPSIAVLPFVDMSPERDQEYFCEGMAEELINGLTQLEGLRVVSRTSSFQFRGKDQDVRKIGEQLKVDTVLEGSVRKAGNRLRVTAQLVKTDDGYHIWSEKYDRDLADVFEIQDEISLAIVEKLKLKLLGEEKDRLVRRYTDNLEAYNLYLKGRHFWYRRDEKSVTTAVGYFEEAVKLDLDYAPAYAGLADCYSILGDHGFRAPLEVFPKAKEAALKALEIDGSLAEAHASLSIIASDYEWDELKALAELKKAIELNPGYATAYHWNGMTLCALGKFEEAIKQIRKAQALDPLAVAINAAAGLILYYSRDFDGAIEEARKAIELHPDLDFPYVILAAASAETPKKDEAIAAIERCIELVGRDSARRDPWYAGLYARVGLEEEARALLEDSIRLSSEMYISVSDIAVVYFLLGEKDEGFKWLERGVEQRDTYLRWMKVDPWLDSVRSEPRFIRIMKQVGHAV